MAVNNLEGEGMASFGFWFIVGFLHLIFFGP